MRIKVPCFAVLAFIVCAGCVAAQAAPQTPAAPTQQFTVLRTGHFNAGVESLTNSDASCSISGAGSAATMRCQRAGKATGSYHFDTALVADPSGMAYVIACRVPLVLVLCRKLNPGIAVEGRIGGRIMDLTDGNKIRHYQILATANIGPLPPGQAPPPKSPAQSRAEPPPAAPPPSNRASNQAQAQPAEPPADSSAACTSATSACVTFVSEPPGADIYVDGKFMGDTPSVIMVPVGSHQLRVEAEKFTPWSRTFEASAGNKVTIRATLQSQPPKN